jgi:ribosomal protein S17E
MDLKERIEKLLSEILSDKYECKITLKFEKEKTA